MPLYGFAFAIAWSFLIIAGTSCLSSQYVMIVCFDLPFGINLQLHLPIISWKTGLQCSYYKKTVQFSSWRTLCQLKVSARIHHYCHNILAKQVSLRLLINRLSLNVGCSFSSIKLLKYVTEFCTRVTLFVNLFLSGQFLLISCKDPQLIHG